VYADDTHGGRGFLLFEQRAVAVANGKSGARAATSAINGADHDPRTRSKLRPQVAKLDRCGPEIYHTTTTSPVLDAARRADVSSDSVDRWIWSPSHTQARTCALIGHAIMLGADESHAKDIHRLD
jgi:hypothetical protein